MDIRAECLRPASGWQRPSGDEIRTVLRLGGLTAAKTAELLGLGEGGGRTVRRWIGEQSAIPYAAWALLCARANLGPIWQQQHDSVAGKL